MISRYTGKRIRKLDPDQWDGKSKAFAKKIVKHWGNAAELAIAAKTSKTTVYNWIILGHIPTRSQKQVIDAGIDLKTLEQK